MLDFGDREIDRPIGQAPRGRQPRDRRTLVATAIGAVALFGLSVLATLHDDGLRSPPPFVVATPEPEPPAAPTDARRPAGPSITRVEPREETDSPSIVTIRDPSGLSRSAATAHLPDPDLIEQSDYGPLPQRSADGRRPFDAYARPWSGARGARVAIVVGGLGLSQTGTQRAIEVLPAEVTLAFAPAGNSLDRWMQTARRKGHELLMQVPLEPFDYPNVDPGRGTLTVDADPMALREDLYWSLGRMTNYTGIMNYMGGRFVADADAMQALMAELAGRGLGYLDDGSSARSVADVQAASAGVPFAAAAVAIDTVRERGDILKKLDEAERVARATGSAIAVGAGFDVTVDAVTAWITEARLRGVEIVGYSALANDPERR
ncbi:MAG: divergent polysaccharide deacetylase family protein [Rhizobiaceae bacterium]|nr:divergent polysaccharide deacetylase family protein [Rhizobiaceae bacterium]